ncbi:MAG: hypothetical protein ISEC1_P1058 [Thiomicrorhabdus sp.]|nr:MAG: hypothetical protein ISEC1_P1058 [Thiomicrorhabdus sp.]
MAGSLFDQLKKAGLVDEKKAKKAKREKYQQTKQQKGKKGQPVISDAAKLAAEAAEKKSEHDRQLNLERQKKQEKKAEKAALRQTIISNQLKGYSGEMAYNFADGSSVKTLNVNPKIHKQLVNGSIRLAHFEGGYALLSEEGVAKVEQRDESILIPLAASEDTLSKEDEDYYAQFEIPDDLVW